jgi:predicted PurR-regulated permease PerM
MPETARFYRQGPFAAPASTLSAVLFAVLIVAALYFGREVLVPIALAILLSFVLAPLVRILQRWRIPRSVSVVAAVFLSFVLILGLGAVMVAQINQLASNLPRYQATLRDKIQSFRGLAAGTGTLERAAEVLHELGKELDRPKAPGPEASLPGGRPAERPIPVEVRQPDPGALQTIAALIAPLIHPLASTGIVFIFVIFMLIQREDLRNRLIRLAGVGDLQRTTAALDDAARRLSRLFLTQLALNAAFGAVIGVGLWIIGVPSAPLWGIMAMILRFVPYIGALIAAIFPLILAAAVGPGWTMVVWTALLFAVVEPVTGHVIEPLVSGRSAGLSPVAIIASATFWTWLWGPIGLVLATPLTVCLAVLGRHVDRLKFLDVMFGDEPVLTPAQLAYQRMLAGDAIEAAEQAQAYLADKPLAAYYEDVLIDSLRLAQADAERGNLDEERRLRIRDVVAEVVDDLSTHVDVAEPAPAAGEQEGSLSKLKQAEEAVAPSPAAVELPAEWQRERRVLCLPGNGPLDEALALIVAPLVERRGLGARMEPAGALSISRFFSLDTEGVRVVCLCYVESASWAQIHYAIRRLRRKLPEASIIVALLGEQRAADQQEISASLPDTRFVSQSLDAVVEAIVADARLLAASTEVLPPVANAPVEPAVTAATTAL